MSTVTNRRQQKRRQTFVSIVEAAEMSFGEIGYDATSMEAIALSAGISVGTVYNYFGTKGAILAATVTMQMDKIMLEAPNVLDLGASDPVDALMPIVEAYLDAMTDYGPDILKDLLRAGLDPGQTELLAGLVSADERILGQLGKSLHVMSSRGMLARGIDIDAAAFLIYSVIAVALMTFASIPGTTPDDVTDMCRAQLELAFAGLIAR
jgi:AcrR family transcriptional regulator